MTILIVILDKDTLYNYIDFPHDIMDTLVSMRKYALFLDLIITVFLFTKGGPWMDFTLYLLNKIPDKYKNTDLCFFFFYGKVSLIFAVYTIKISSMIFLLIHRTISAGIKTRKSTC